MSKSSLPFEYHPQEEPKKVKTSSKCICPPLEEPTKVKKKEKGPLSYLDGKKRNGLDDIELDIESIPDNKTPSAKSVEDHTIEAPESSANEISIQCDLPTTPKKSIVKHDIEVVIEPRIEMKQMDASLGYSNIYSTENFDHCDASLCRSTPSQNTNSDDLDLPNLPISRSPLQYGLRYNSGYPPTPPPPPPTQPPTAQCLHCRGPTCYPYNNPSECSTFLSYNPIANPPCCLPKRPPPNCTPPAYSSNFPAQCQSKYFPPSVSPVCSPRRPLTCGQNFTSHRALSCPPRARCISPCRAAHTSVLNRCPSPDSYSLPMNASTTCPLPQRVPSRTPSPCPLTCRSRSPTVCPPLVRNPTACQSSCTSHGRNISPNNIPLRCPMPCPPLRSPIPYSTMGAPKSASQTCSLKFVQPPSSSQSPLLSAYSNSKGEPCTLPTHAPCSPGRRSFMKRLLFKKKA